MSLPRLKPHKQVNGRQMNIMLDALESLIRSSLPEYLINSKIINDISGVSSITGVGVGVTQPTGDVGLLLGPGGVAVQYLARRSAIGVQTIPTGSSLSGGTTTVNFPVIEADPYSEATGANGFTPTHGSVFLVHAQVGFQSPGAASDLLLYLTVDGGAGNVGSQWRYSNRTLLYGVISAEVWMTVPKGRFEMFLSPNTGGVTAADILTTGDPSQCYMEIYCLF